MNHPVQINATQINSLYEIKSILHVWTQYWNVAGTVIVFTGSSCLWVYQLYKTCQFHLYVEIIKNGMHNQTEVRDMKVFTDETSMLMQ